MKKYNVTISYKGEIISDFQIKADNFKQAKRFAQTHKRMSKFKGNTYVRLNK